jgi:hypothetical protein
MARTLRSPLVALALGLVLLLAVLGAASIADPVADTAVSVKKKVAKALKLGKKADKRSKQALKKAKEALAKQAIPGPQGATGPAGRSALTTLKSGETVRGGIGHRDAAATAGDSFEAWASLPIPAPTILLESNTLINNFAEGANQCTGSNSAPTAPRGKVCVYADFDNATSISSQGSGNRFGFGVYWEAFVMGNTDVRGSWAYTAP